MAIVAVIKNLFYFFQKVEQSNADYHEDFMAMLKVSIARAGCKSPPFVLGACWGH